MGGSTRVSCTPGIIGWHWTFGDGGMSLAHHPTHTYNVAGVYTVSLLITDSLGYTATHIAPQAITVAPWRVFLPLVLRHP
jgi:PKD repeat protein